MLVLIAFRLWPDGHAREVGDALSGNPWLVEQTDPVEQAPPPRADVDGPHARGVQHPQQGLPVVDAVDRLPQVVVDRPGPWVIGAHGGSGESTLAAWLGWTAAGHAWPLTEGLRPVGIVVARTSGRGLEAARHAVTEWASGAVAVDLMGLVLMGDAPGKLPPELRAQVRQLSGAAPATWVVKYLPELRVAARPDQSAPAGAVRALRSIEKILAEKEHS